MLNRLFGNYLVKKEIMSKDKLDGLFPLDKEKKAQISTITVIKKVLSASQVISILSEIDKETERFSDVVVANDILLDYDIDKLISFQNNKFYRFLQILLDDGVLELESMNSLIDEFQNENNFSNEEMELLICDDLEGIIHFMVPCEDDHVNSMILTMMRTFRRLIDANVYMGRGVVETSVNLDSYSSQLLSGDFNVVLYFTGDGDNLLGIANYFTDLNYEHICEDALDNVGEFINCINGQVATDFSYDDVDVDMGAPEYSMLGSSITGRRYYIIPISANGYSFRAVIDVTL